MMISWWILIVRNNPNWLSKLYFRNELCRQSTQIILWNAKRLQVSQVLHLLRQHGENKVADCVVIPRMARLLLIILLSSLLLTCCLSRASFTNAFSPGQNLVFRSDVLLMFFFHFGVYCEIFFYFDYDLLAKVLKVYLSEDKTLNNNKQPVWSETFKYPSSMAETLRKAFPSH